MAFFAAFIHRQFICEPPVPTASFKGKTVIVTGASSGLGLEAARWLVRLGASKVILACRNVEKAEVAVKDISGSTSCIPDTLEVWKLDMSSYASVLAFADRVKADLPRVDAVLANAGIGTRKFRTTEDNEETITTNVVSTALIACLLHSKLRETASKFNTQTHLTVTASELYEVAAFKERAAPSGKIFATLNDQSTANMADRYNVSKLLEIFLVKQIGSMSPVASSGVIVNSVAPGFCQSELARDYTGFFVRVLIKMLARRTEVGARTLLYGASVGPESHGQYVPDCKIKETKGLTIGAEGAKLQERVWQELKDKLEAIWPGVTSLT